MIVIVDDEDVVRDALAWLCRSRGLQVRDYGTAEALLADLDAGRLDLRHSACCLLLDVRMPGLSGLEAFEQLRARGVAPPATVIFLTGHGEVPMAVEMLKAGAFDFVEKPFSDNRLIDRLIEGVALSRARIAASAASAGLDTLSPREREVMERVLAGKINKVIADELGISMRTVEVHRSRVFEKMGVKSAVELAQLMK